MDLHLDPDASSAPYEQIRSQITDRVRSGELAPGTRLPTVRAPAAELGLDAEEGVALVRRAFENQRPEG